MNLRDDDHHARGGDDDVSAGFLLLVGWVLVCQLLVFVAVVLS